MNGQEANEYMQAALLGAVKLSGLEKTILVNLTEANKEITKLSQHIQQTSMQLEQAKSQLLVLNGRRDSYAHLLITEETTRRSLETQSSPNLEIVHPEKQSPAEGELGEPELKMLKNTKRALNP
jgi:hypothetical protein